MQILQSLIQMLQKMLGINPQQQQPGQGLPGQANQQAGNGAASASAAANGGSAAASAAASSSTVITLPPGFDLSKIQVYQNGQQQPLNLTQNPGNPAVPWAPGQTNPYSGGGTPPCHQQNQSQFPYWPQVPGPQLV
ncbi:MAG: hypothetical protein HYU64_00550 [Armatimonadetes bacterium]|nr:hypothetical protein [Armatimonadota bacterium]